MRCVEYQWNCASRKIFVCKSIVSLNSMMVAKLHESVMHAVCAAAVHARRFRIDGTPDAERANNENRQEGGHACS